MPLYRPTEENYIVITLNGVPKEADRYTPPAESMTYLKLKALVKCDDGARAVIVSEYGIDRTGGSAPVIIGSTTKTPYKSGASANQCDINLVIDGNDLVYQVTGPNSVISRWGVHCEGVTSTFFNGV